MATAAQQISQIYVGYFNRAPDPAGLQYWINHLNNGMPLGEIADYFATEQETLDLYPYLREPDLNSVNDFIDQIYNNLFNRDADPAGKAFWKAQLESGAVSEGEFIAAIANGATGEGRLVLDNKVAVGVYFATELSQNNVVWDATALDAAYQALTGVTQDPDTVLEAKGQIDSFVETGAWPGTVGETFTLTAGIDAIVGTAANDTVQGVLSAEGTSTLNPLDSIDGGAGVNRLVMVVNGEIEALPVATTIKNIQNVELVLTNDGAIENLNTGYFGEQVKTVWQISGGAGEVASSITLSKDGQAAGFRGGDNGFMALGQAEVVAGANVTNAAVALDGVASGQVVRFAGQPDANSLTEVTVSGSVLSDTDVNPIANELTIETAIDDTQISTINLALTSNTTVEFLVEEGILSTIDASASTGNLTISLETMTALEALIGGSGNDRLSVDIDPTATVSSLTVDGGAGDDTITFGALARESGNLATSLIGGGGNDTFIISELSNIGTTGVAALESNLVTIEDFNGGDILVFKGPGQRAFVTTTEMNEITSQNTLTAALDTAARILDASMDDGIFLFNYGGDAYAFNSTNTTFGDGDGVMKIAGYSVEQFTSQNLVFTDVA